MELKAREVDALAEYLSYYTPLVGDKRTLRAFQGTVKGIIGAESLVCTRIAAHSPELSASANGEQRIRRMVSGETTEHSTLDAAAITQRLRERGIEQLRGEEEIWVMVDGSDLRKPYAHEMEALMRVPALEGKGLTNGYRTLNAFGIGRERRGILYHRLFSSQEEEFRSESVEIQEALRTIIAASQPLGARIIYGLDSGFDDVAVWGTIWEADQHLVCRVYRLNRLVEQQTATQSWQRVSLEEAARQLHEWAVVETELVVQKPGQTYAKRQAVKTHIAACTVRISYKVDMRTQKTGAQRRKQAWLVKVTPEDTGWDPWWLLTDLPVEDADSATRVLIIYRQRWAAEDTFKVSKECLGWEEIQLLDLEAVRNLTALAWVAAGFLYELGVTFEWPEIRILARLGGWEERKDPKRRPGKIVLMRGLRRLLDLLATEAILADEIATHGALPPRLAALIGRLRPS
jgi:Transposase DDE domain